MASRVLVVGSGAIGLRASLELLRRNVKVVLRSPRHPLNPKTCSQGAGGLWNPFHCDDPRTDRWSLETLEELHPMAQDRNNSLVETVPTVLLHRDHQGPETEDFLAKNYKDGRGGTSPLPTWSSDPRVSFQHLTVEMLWWQNHVHKLKIPTEDELKQAGYLHAWFFRPPIVDCPQMLMNMLKEVESNADDVNVETDLEYESVQHLVEDAKSLNCDAVLNCTGMGAAKLCNDNQLIGGRGVMLLYDRKSCIRREASASSMHSHEGEYGAMVNDACVLTEDAPWGSSTFPCYLIVRGDTIVVGGSYLEGDTEPGIRPKEREMLYQYAHRLGIDTTRCQPKGEWTGFRPYRRTCRLEEELQYATTDNVRVVHSYGYGGSGWTVYVGAAKEATRILLKEGTK